MPETDTTSALRPNQAPVPLLSRLETVARLGAVAGFTAYAAGFIVVTLHHAQLGILQFDILRPRVILAGAVFLLFVLLATYIAFWFFNLSFVSRPKKGLSDDPNHQGLLELVAGCEHCATCLYLTIYFPFVNLLAKPKVNVGMDETLFALSALCFLIIVGLGSRWFKRSPRIWTGLICAATVAIFVVAGAYRTPSLILGGWLALVGLGAVWINRSFQSVGELKAKPLNLNLIGAVSSAILIYSTQIYGGISAAYGGGAPVPVVVYCVGDHPLATNRILNASMVDETDKGYFLLLPPLDSGGAVFFPREQVGAIVSKPGNRLASNPPQNVPTKPAAKSPPQSSLKQPETISSKPIDRATSTPPQKK